MRDSLTILTRAPLIRLRHLLPHVSAWGRRVSISTVLQSVPSRSFSPAAAGGEEPALSDDERSEEESKGGRRPDEGAQVNAIGLKPGLLMN